MSTCKYLAQDSNGRCWSHRADVRKLKAVARLSCGVSVDQVVAVTGLPAAVVDQLAAAVRDLLEGG